MAPTTGNRKILSILLNTKTKWEPGWTHATFVPTSGGQRLLTYNAASGELQSRGIGPGSGIGGLGQGMSVSAGTGWTTVEGFSAGGVSYVLLLSESTGRVMVRPLDKSGIVEQATYTNRWSAGWSTATPYMVGSATYVLLLKRETGEVHIHPINADGSFASEVERHDWTAGWSTVSAITHGSDTFLLILKQETGLVHVYRVRADGSLGARVERRRWSAGWTTARFYRSGRDTFLFLMKEATGEVHIHLFATDGTIGPEVERYDWTSGWSTVSFYRASGRSNLFLLRASNGDGHLHAMNDDGTVGPRINTDEPRPVSDYRRLMTGAGKGENLLADYINDQSEGRLTIAGSTVVGWITHDGSWEELKTRGRNGQILAGIEAARLRGVRVNDYDHFVVFVNEGPNSGAAGAGALIRPGRETLEFIAHELFHDMGLDHSFSDDPSRKVAAWEKDGEYDDPWDIMSALRAHGYGAVEFAQRGPNLNAFGRSMQGWLDENDVETLETDRLIAGQPVQVRIAGLGDQGSGNRVVRVYAPDHEFLSIEHRPATGWDRATSPGPLIHRISAAKYFGSEQDRRTWTSGWTSGVPYRAGHGSFLLLVKEGTGDVQARRLDDDGRLGRRIDQRQWGPGWSTVETFEQYGATYLFLLKAGTGEVLIHRFNLDGTIGQEMQRLRWSPGWTTAEFYNRGSGAYLFLLKERTGEVHIHRMTGGGDVGPMIEKQHWSGGWSTARVFTVAQQPYLLLLKQGTGDVHIHELHDDGTIGDLVQNLQWSPGFDIVEILGADPTYLLLGKSNSKPGPDGRGEFTIHEIGTGGSVNAGGKTAQWTSGWDTMVPFTTRLGRYLLGLKSGAGTVFTQRLCYSYLMRDAKAPGRDPRTSTSIADVDIDVVDEGRSAVVTLTRRFSGGETPGLPPR